MILELEVDPDDLGYEIGQHEDWAVLNLIQKVAAEKSGTSFAGKLVLHMLSWIKESYDHVDFEDFVLEVARWADDNG